MSIKNFILIFLLLTSGFTQAQRTLSNEMSTAGAPPEPCPPGYVPTLHINLEIFNFHKPRTNCSASFGLCCRLSSTVTCEPNFHKPAFDGHFVSCAALVTEQTVELRVPAVIRRWRDSRSRISAILRSRAELGKSAVMVRSRSM